MDLNFNFKVTDEIIDQAVITADGNHCSSDFDKEMILEYIISEVCDINSLYGAENLVRKIDKEQQKELIKMFIDRYMTYVRSDLEARLLS